MLAREAQVHGELGEVVLEVGDRLGGAGAILYSETQDDEDDMPDLRLPRDASGRRVGRCCRRLLPR